ncbi:hypothetical protein Tco_0335634 [Tanacetum coccineum]
METIPAKDYILLPIMVLKNSHSSLLVYTRFLNARFKPSREEEKKDVEDLGKLSDCEVQYKGSQELIQENPMGMADDPNMPNWKKLSTSNMQDEDKNAEADIKQFKYIYACPVLFLTTRLHKDHPLEQIIRDTHSASQTRRMTKSMTEHDFKTKAFDVSRFQYLIASIRMLNL